MTFKTRCQLLYGIISASYLFIVLLVYLALKQDFLVCLTNHPLSCLAGGLILGIPVLIIGMGFITYSLWRIIIKPMFNRIREILDYLKLTAAGESPEMADENFNDPLSELRLILKELLQRLNQEKKELEKNYQRIQLTNMDFEEKYAQSYTVQLILEEIGRELDSDNLLKKASDIIMGIFGSNRCTIYMVDEEKEMLVPKADTGFGNTPNNRPVIPFYSDNIIARSWRNRRVYTEGDIKPKELEEMRARNIFNIQTIPLIGRRGCLGVIVIEHGLAGGLRDDLLEFAKLIAQELSLSVENAYLYGKMRHMANHDALTGIYNRMYLMNYLAELFAKKPATVSLIMFDLDHFKRINDQFSHLTGDLVLERTTFLIQKLLPQSGVLARYGGEEFVVVLPEYKQERAFKLADSIRVLISEYDFSTVEGKNVPVTISAGVANYPMEAASYESLLQFADQALYEAKNSGRNKVYMAEATPNHQRAVKAQEKV